MKATERNISLTDADYAAIVKRYEDAGDAENADIIRRQWEVARASASAHQKTAETRMDAESHTGARRVRARRGTRLTNADYAAIVKRYEDAGDVQNADIIRRQWEAARASAAPKEVRSVDQATPIHQAWVENGRWIDIDPADIAGYRSCFATIRTLYATPPTASTAPAVRTWRERIGVGTDFPLHAPTDVERAMEAEIAELRERLNEEKGSNDERT